MKTRGTTFVRERYHPPCRYAKTKAPPRVANTVSPLITKAVFPKRRLEVAPLDELLAVLVGPEITAEAVPLLIEEALEASAANPTPVGLYRNTE